MMNDRNRTEGPPPHRAEPIIGRRTTVLLSLALAACALSGPDAPQVSAGAEFDFDDPEVTRVYDRMMEVAAPDNGWERARYLEFSWDVGQGDGSSIGPKPLLGPHGP